MAFPHGGASAIWRDFVIDASPGSGAHEPVKGQVRDWGAVLEDKLNETPSVNDFAGADFEARLNAAIASGAAAIFIPPGSYTIAAAITMTAPVLLVGVDPARTIIRQTTATADGLVWDFASYLSGGGLIGITVEAGAGFVTAGFAGTGSSGAGVSVAKSNTQFVLQRFGINNFAVGLHIRGCFEVSAKDFRILYCASAGLRIGRDGTDQGAGNQFRDGDVSNFNFTGTNTASVGLDLQCGSGEYFDNVDFKVFNNNIRLKPGADEIVRFTFFQSVLGDTGQSTNWLIDGTGGGEIVSNQAIQCWSSNSQGLGVLFSGASDAFNWSGGWIRTSVLHGLVIGALATNVRFGDGVKINRNSATTAGTYHGVVIEKDASSWTLDGCRIGNIAAPEVPGNQGYGVFVVAGASQDASIVNCDLRDNLTGPLLNGSTIAFTRLEGNSPRQVASLNITAAETFSGGSMGAVAAGATVFLGQAGATAGAQDAPFTSSRAGVVSRLYAAAQAAPGAGQTFTYTVMKNGVATSMTGQIADAATTLITDANAFTVSDTDNISVRLVTSAGVLVTTHRFSVRIEP